MTFRKKVACRLLALCAAFTALPVGGMVHVSAENAETNLVAGLPYTVETGVGIAHSYGQSGAETDPSEGKLTDGKRAQANSYGDAAWHKFYRGYTRSVTFTLPEVKAVTGFSVSLIQIASAGLPMPPSFDLFVSENGTDYMLAASYDTTSLFGVKENTLREIRAEHLGRFRAKYVRLRFRCEVSVYVDEIEVYGNDIDGTEAEFVPYEEAPAVGQYDAGIDGCREMVLLYCGYPGEYTEDYVNNTEEKLLPYFGYVDREGKIRDTFFDSFMFSALRGASPSGGNFCQNGGGMTVMSDWEYFLDNLFSEKYNCGAIEKVMDRVKEETGQTDAQVSLVINMPYPTIGTLPFGDINGDGKPEYCRNTKEQLAIYQWFFDRVEQILAERNYKNIRFGGYYWGAESMGAETEAEDSAFVKSVADLIHKRNSYLFWIPLLYGVGFTHANELGFDCAMMQPNYSFLEYADENCFAEIDSELKKYGLGIEIEISWNATSKDEYLARYYSYLNAGYALGYEQNTAHSYYQNAAPGTFYHLSKSSSSKLRNAYDDTYAFVKRVYEPRKITLKGRTFGTVDPGTESRGVIRIADGGCAASLGTAVWTVSKQPEHGSVELNQDGIYCYKPDDGYIGTDSFSVCLKAAYASSEELTIELRIGPETPEESSASASEATMSDAESTTPPTEKRSAPIGLFIGIGCVVAAVIGAVVAVLVRKKKKA